MAKAEIEESDLLNLQHISGVVDQVMKTPETRQAFLQLAKRANPKLPIPEVDAAAPVIAAVNGIREDLNKFRTEQAEKERLAQEQAAIAALNNKWASAEEQMRRAGWRQAGIDQVKQFAEQNGIADLGIAADAFERRNPQPAPADSRAAGWNVFAQDTQEDTYIKDQMAAMGESDARLDKEIRDTLAEIRSGY